MSRSVAARVEDVRKIVAAARRMVERREELITSMVESTGLSEAGVELALTQYLELDPTDEELHLLVARAGEASKVAVILSANVFVGALRALAIARAASNVVIVRPSRRDPAFARALVAEVGDPALRVDENLEVSEIEHGEIHVYGRDDTIAHVHERARSGVRVRGHGSGMGVAWISSDGAIEACARALAEDVVVFDQRGCLSPRVALVAGDLDRASDFAQALHAELEKFDRTVPRGQLSMDEGATSSRYVATMTYAGNVLVGTGHAVGIAPEGSPMVLPPAYRHVHVAACTTTARVTPLLEPMCSSIIAVGTDAEDEARHLAPPWVRISALGRMQRPPLDGPVDLREAK